MAPSDLEKPFSDLIVRGINLTRAAQEGDAIYVGIEALHNAFRDYHIWKSDIKDFLTQADQNTIEWFKFYESDSVPSFKGGEGYDDIRSEKSQILLRNIRTETSRKLELLKEVGSVIFQKNLPKTPLKNENIFEIKTDKNYFSFNVITGDTLLNSTTCTFKPGQQKFKILSTLVKANELQADYQMLCDSIGLQNTKPNRASIQQIIKTIKEDLKILPLTENSNPDIFMPIERHGFRIIIA